MAILSDEFYYQHINLDTVNTQVFTNLTSKVGDTNGRGLIVTLTENGLQKDTTGISLNLKWKHRSIVGQGLDNFDVVDSSKGVYKITYPTEMNRSGLVDAFVQIVDSGKVVGTRNMIISVESTVGDDSAIESSDSFSALASALIEVQSWNARIDDVEQDFIDRANNLDATYPTRLVSVETQLAQTMQIINVKKYGAKGDGVTDDTVAIQSCIDLATTNGGGRIYFPRGEYIVSGALRNQTEANAQLILPNLTYGNSEQITIEFIGEIPPPAIAYVIEQYTILPKKHVVIRSTLNAGVGGCILGAWGNGPANFTNILVKMENIAFRLPENPVLTALDFSRVASVDVDNVVADSSNYNIRQLVEPTTPTSHGIKWPAIYNGAHTRIGSVDVIGFYNGHRFGEHSNGQQVAAWGCYNGFVFERGDHASAFQRLNAHHNKNNVVFLGTHYVNVFQLNIEHVNDPLIWYNTVNDIDDANNYGQGSISYSVVAAFLGQQGADQVFTINGAGNLIVKAMFNKGKYWNSAVLQNNWVKATDYGYPTVQYKINSEGMVTIRGSVQGGTAGTPITTLPAGYRPLANLIFPCVSAGKIGTIEIYGSGDVKPSLELGNTILSLDVINFYTS